MMDELEQGQEVERMADWSVQFLQRFSSHPANGEYTAGNLANRYIFHCKIRNEQSIADAVKYDMEMERKAHVSHPAVDTYLDDVFPSLKKKAQRALAVSLENNPNILYDGDRRGRLYRFKTTRPSIRARDVAVFISYYLYQNTEELNIRYLGEEVREWATDFHMKIEHNDQTGFYRSEPNKPYLLALSFYRPQATDFPFSFNHPDVKSKYKREYGSDLLEWCKNVYTETWFKYSFSNILRYLRKELDCISEGSKRGLWIHKNHCFKEDEIERVKDMKLKMSVTDIGEKLEQWCENQFNLVRATAFPHAYFEKDNESIKDEEDGKGTKGDYIFRDSDVNGIEYISIMFEMKDKMEGTKGQTNESHLSKLDKDRKKKKCEYAVLVSMLEPENELYNAGPVDMSYKYEKMYVVRPQEFMLILSLIRNEARKSLEMRNELAVIRNQNIDYETFENKLLDFQEAKKNLTTTKTYYQSPISQSKQSMLAEERLGKVVSEEVDLTDILEFGNHFSRLHNRVLSLENPDVVPIMLKQLEAQIELMLINTKKQQQRDIPPLQSNTQTFSDHSSSMHSSGRFEVSESEENRPPTRGEFPVQGEIDIDAGDAEHQTKDKIWKFLIDQPRDTAEILAHINSTKRHETTAQQLTNYLSKAGDIVKIGYIKRSGILSGGYDICEWATRNWVSRNCPGWQEGTPITIDDDGNVTTGASTD
jgi:hypothetical protein